MTEPLLESGAKRAQELNLDIELAKLMPHLQRPRDLEESLGAHVAPRSPC